MKKSIFSLVIISLVSVFSLLGCIEHRYYATNHRHSERYYHRHPQEPPREVDINAHH